MKLTFLQIQLVELKHHSVGMAYTHSLQTVILYLIKWHNVYLDYFIIAGGGGGGGNHGAGGGVGGACLAVLKLQMARNLLVI